MGSKYDQVILRTFILYDDGSSADPYVFTYPATNVTKSDIKVNFTQMLASVRSGELTQIHEQDMFEPTN